MFSKLVQKLITLLAFMIYVLPRPLKDLLGRLIGLIWFDVVRIRRKTAIQNVQLAFPEMSTKEATRIARQSLIHMGYNIVEVFSFPFLTKEKITEQFDFPSKEKLDKAFEKGQGVMMLSAHIANGDLATAALSHYGYPTHLVSKVFESGWLNDFWFNARQKHGTTFIPPRRSSYDILKALKKNEMVIFVLDQYTGPPNGIVTRFFGIETGTALGPSLFVKRSGSVVVPAYSYRKKFGDNVIVVGDPIEFEERDSKEATLVHNTQKYCDAIEEIVRSHPEQWMWIHRRWKGAWIQNEKGEYVKVAPPTTV